MGGWMEILFSCAAESVERHRKSGLSYTGLFFNGHEILSLGQGNASVPLGSHRAPARHINHNRQVAEIQATLSKKKKKKTTFMMRIC